MVSMADRLIVQLDADSALAEMRALAEEYRQIVADLRGLQELAEISKQAWTTTAELRRAARPTDDPHGALDRWRALETDPAPMDGSTVLLAAFEESGAPTQEWSTRGFIVWACAAEWHGSDWFALLPDGTDGTAGTLIRPYYPPTHWRLI